MSPSNHKRESEVETIRMGEDHSLVTPDTSFMIPPSKLDKDIISVIEPDDISPSVISS